VTILQTLQNVNALVRMAPDAAALLVDAHRALGSPCACATGGPPCDRCGARARLASVEGVQRLAAVAADLVRPGAGPVAGRVVEHGVAAYHGLREVIAGDVIEGEFTVEELPGPEPWSGYARWMASRPSGGWVYLGPRGSGKTSKARQQAKRLRARGFRVKGVNLWGHDNPGWIEPITLDEFVRVSARIRTYLARQTECWRPDLGAIDPGARAELEELLEPIADQCLIVDEASLSLEGSGAGPERLVVAQVLNNARHVGIHVILVAQLARQFPESILSETVIVSRPTPTGDEARTDRTDNPLAREIWREAARGHQAIDKRWRAWWPDFRSWAWVRCPWYLDGRVWTGMMPFERDSEAA
jgi:hypothetical protein